MATKQSSVIVRLGAPGIVLLLFIGACTNGPQPQRLPTTEIQIGIETIEVEVARTRRERATGMKYRKRLGKNEGMLFVFPDDDERAFFMKDTTVPLSIAFIRSDGAVARIADMEPLSTDLHRSGVPCRFALEMPQGWFEAHGVGEGMKVQIPASVLDR